MAFLGHILVIVFFVAIIIGGIMAGWAAKQWVKNGDIKLAVKREWQSFNRRGSGASSSNHM